MRSVLDQQRNAAIRLQKEWRGAIARSGFSSAIASARRIQSAIRGFLVRSVLDQLGVWNDIEDGNTADDGDKNDDGEETHDGVTSDEEEATDNEEDPAEVDDVQEEQERDDPDPEEHCNPNGEEHNEPEPEEHNDIEILPLQLPLRRSARLASLPKVDYNENASRCRSSLRRSPRLARLPRVNCEQQRTPKSMC